MDTFSAFATAWAGGGVRGADVGCERVAGADCCHCRELEDMGLEWGLSIAFWMNLCSARRLEAEDSRLYSLAAARRDDIGGIAGASACVVERVVLTCLV